MTGDDFVALDEIADVRSGATPSKSRPEYWDGDIPWVSAKDMKSRRLRDAEDHISVAGLDSGSRLAPPDATLVLIRGMTLLSDVPICRLERDMAFNQDVKAIVPKDTVDPAYLTYALLAAKPELMSMVELAGHGTGRLPTDRLKALEIRLPAKPEQRSIAHILGTLDDKIELNRRMNETLEAIARALFKSWFVDFDPVSAKAEGRDTGLPSHIADLFPDRFEDSDLGAIPAGWTVGQLGDVADHPRRGIQPSAMDASTPYIALEHMPKRCIALTEWGTAEGLESNKFSFKRREILFGKLRPYFHKVGVGPVDGVCSTDIVVVAPRSDDLFGFVLGHVSSTDFVDYTDAGSTGTKMPRTSWNEMARYPVVLPPDNVSAAFTSHSGPMVDRIIASIHESRTLAALRDALLPKLISGEIRVKDAERFAPEAA